MKARVIETNEIVELQEDMNSDYFTKDGIHLKGFELDFNVEQSDYWEKLKHQAVILAMQGLLSNSAYLENFIKYCAKNGDHLARVVSANAIDYATILIDKLKEEEK